MYFFYQDSSEVLTGRYRVSGGEMILSSRAYNGEKLDGDAALPFELSGDLLTINGEPCSRVPNEYIDAVLADPYGPYPPGSGDFEWDWDSGDDFNWDDFDWGNDIDWENFDWDNIDWDSLFG
jgi:hypothetical protein